MSEQAPSVPDPKIDRSVPVSREDYDRMADQRDRFRASLIDAKAELGEANRAIDEIVDRLKEFDTCDRSDAWVDACFDLGRAAAALHRALLAVSR
jgi:ribosome assembly protein YihI (activator of Der GTPase)